MSYTEDLEERCVLVTGANGFVGSHLVDSLVEKGADVIAFVEADSSGHQNLGNVREEVEFFRGDLRDPVSVREAVGLLEGYDEVLVFHLGAQAHVGESWDRPHETVRTNVLGTLNLLEAIREQDIDIEKFVSAGTSEEYGSFNEDKENGYRKQGDAITLDENSPINPKSIYATSKVAADFLTRNYYEAYEIPAVTTRMFNNYGPRQNPRFITGTVITQALKRQVVELGDLRPKRDMCYISDGVKGHIHTALHGEPGEVYVFGSGEAVTMRQWANIVIETGEKQGLWENVEIQQVKERFRPGNSEVEELRAGYEKLNDLTGWEPEVGREEGIRRTIEWYANNERAWKGLCGWK